jgi:hypothetical protein
MNFQRADLEICTNETNVVSESMHNNIGTVAYFASLRGQ